MSAGRTCARLAAAVLLAAAAAGCAEPLLPPQVEAGGEPGAPVYRASGLFTGSDTNGSATYLIDDEGQAALSLSSDFAVRAVPRVSIFLSNTPDLAEAVKVAELPGTSGAMRWTFRVPRGAVWRWVVLWSEEGRVQVARAELLPR